jgi:3',5'-cyclic-AMP phosphodiesterase
MKTPRNPAMAGTNRREFIATAAVASATLAAAPFVRLAADSSAPASHGFRFVFLPCIHLRRDLRSPEGFANALRAVSRLSPAPDFILTGGDMCHNMRDQTLEQSVEITEMFLRICREHCSVPVHHCLGNHDLAAWNQVADAAQDPRYGKNLIVQKFGIKDRYYSFDHKGWHLIVLDYLRVSAPGQFTAEIDPDQLEWLREDLARHKKRPALIVTHAPVISVVELLGHSFICSGSVSGHQWTGPRMGTPEGFGVFDCEADGTLGFRYESHGWTA